MGTKTSYQIQSEKIHTIKGNIQPIAPQINSFFSIHLIPFNHLRRKTSEHDDFDDDDFMIDFTSVQAGSEFAIYRDSQSKLYTIGKYEWGQALNKKPTKSKRLKRLVPRHDLEFQDFRSFMS